ncbi:hypothetical protein [Methanopyrus sp. KOL6]|uniref:hypothetical protein n=1 Tax=Methanopyrus sp. KOL6 TaxID=1937004 RepID=UPI000B4BA56F|nr:hypothetical protein [Methanopyrus sp. KOL6]
MIHPSRLFVKLSASPRVDGEIVACGTKYDPITEEELEIVETLNSMYMLLTRFEGYPLPAPQVISNELGEVAEELRRKGFGLTRIERFKYDDPEVALVSKIVLDETRYVYCTYSNEDDLQSLAHECQCTVLEYAGGEATVEAPSKFHALRFAAQVPLRLRGSAAIGLTQAAATERFAKAERHADSEFAAFSKIGAEWIIHRGGDPLPLPRRTNTAPDRILYLDIVGSSELVRERGRRYLEGIMSRVIDVINEEEGVVLDHRRGGDDVIARFPTKSRALRAAIKIVGRLTGDDVKIKIGIGDSRGRAAENAVTVRERVDYDCSYVAFRFGPHLVAYVEPPDYAVKIFGRIPSESVRAVGASAIVGSLTALHPYLALPFFVYFPIAAARRNRDSASVAVVWFLIWVLVTLSSAWFGLYVREHYLPRPLVLEMNTLLSQLMKLAKTMAARAGAGTP